MVLKMQSFVSFGIPVFVALMLPLAVSADTVEETFNWYCAQCHGTDGTGDGVNSSVEELPVSPMNLTSAAEMEKYTGEKIGHTLTEGGPVNILDSLMPPWGDRLTKKQIEELAKYVLAFCKEEGCPKK